MLYFCSMEKIGSLEIKITGSKNNVELTPDNYDIQEMVFILQNAEKLLYSGDKKNRPLITCEIENNCVKHIIKTSMQHIIIANALIGGVVQNGNIDFLECQRAEALEGFQKFAIKNNCTLDISTSLDQTSKVKIDKTTNFYKKDAVWVDADFYFYGNITSAGGKDNSNIHVVTDKETVIIGVEKAFLKEYEKNLIYKDLAVHAVGKQNPENGEIDKSTLKFIEFVDYNPKYGKAYLDECIERGTKTWSDVEDVDLWLHELRGNYA